MRILLLLLLGMSGLQAQNLRQTIAFADSLYCNGAFAQAAGCYQRALFFGGDHPLSAHCASQLGWCEAALGHYPEAIKALELAQSRTADSAQLPLVLGKAAVQVAAGTALAALESLEFYRQRLPADQVAALYPSLGVAWFALGEVDSAFQFFRLAAGPDSLVRMRLDSLERRFRRGQRLNPAFGYGLSLLLPGAGQVYAGRGGEAANSLVLVGSLLAAGLWMAVTYTPFDAMLTVFPWFWRYYLGGAWHARDLVQQHRARLRAHTLQTALSLLDVPAASFESVKR